MTVADVLRGVRARWLLFVTCLIIPIAAALAVSRASPPSYLSTAQLFVAAPGPSSTPDAYQGALFAQQQAPSYAELATSPAVLRAVIGGLGLDSTPAGLANEVSAIAPANSVLIDVTARASSAPEARNIANETAVQLAAAAEHLAASGDHRHPQLTLRVVKPAVLPATRSSHTKTDLILGIIVGLAVGFAVIVLREKSDARVRTTQDAELAVGCPLVTVMRAPPRPRPWRRASTRVTPGGPEAFRRLRIQLAPLMTRDGTQTLTVTSLAADDAGAAVALNLALALAECGTRVALLDLDPGSTVIADSIGIAGPVGVGSVLAGRTPLDAAIHEYGPRLLVLPAGPASAWPAQSTSPDRLTELSTLLEHRADQVIVHVGALLADARGAELCAAAPPVVLTTQPGKARQAELRLVADVLRGAGTAITALVLADRTLATMTSAFQVAAPIPAEVATAGANGTGHHPPRRLAPIRSRRTMPGGEA